MLMDKELRFRIKNKNGRRNPEYYSVMDTVKNIEMGRYGTKKSAMVALVSFSFYHGKFRIWWRQLVWKLDYIPCGVCVCLYIYPLYAFCLSSRVPYILQFHMIGSCWGHRVLNTLARFRLGVQSFTSFFKRPQQEHIMGHSHIYKELRVRRRSQFVFKVFIVLFFLMVLTRVFS